MNWKKLLGELRAVGLTQQEIAEHCRVSQSTVSDIGRGQTKSPGFEIGAALLALHKKHCGNRTNRRALGVSKAAA